MSAPEVTVRYGRAWCVCGRSVLPENWDNHLMRQDGRPHHAKNLPPEPKDVRWPETQAGRDLANSEPVSIDAIVAIEAEAVAAERKRIEIALPAYDEIERGDVLAIVRGEPS